MSNSYSTTRNNLIKYILCIFLGAVIGLIIGMYWRSYSNYMHADIYVGTYGAFADTHYFINVDDSENAVLSAGLGAEIFATYKYEVPKDAVGVDYLKKAPNGSAYNGVEVSRLNDNYVIASYKSDVMYNDRLNHHFLDQLIYLNENNQTAEVVYECYGAIRILYGNSEYVIVYHAETNTYRYITISDENTFNIVEANINHNRGLYIIYVSEEDNCIYIERSLPFFNINIDTLIMPDISS